ncbi:MAG: ComEC/Rec2 family competence protein [Muribaculaceae bacterium]
MLVAGVSAALVLGFIGRNDPLLRFRIMPWHSLPIAIISLALGCFAAYTSSPKKLSINDINGKVISGTIESVRITEKSMSMYVQTSTAGKILLSTKGHNSKLKVGTDIAFRADLHEMQNLGNPFEFDYKQYLYNHGIIYTQHTDASQILSIGKNSGFRHRIARYRQIIENYILKSRLSHDAKSFVIAIILGNNDYISPESQDSFSKAGAAHILAVSGLHVGIIALIIWCILFPLDYYRRRRLRLVVTIIIIALYAIFTGLSPSVVRASIMTTFAFAELILFRRNTSLNALLVAALIILLFSPFSLYEVGFQLSFCTVAAILLIVPKLREIVYVRNRILNYMLSSIWVSLAAMISTSAITAYYFHSIPLLAFATNLIILPLMPVFMVLYIIYIVILIIYGELSFLTTIVEYSYKLLYTIVSTISNLGFSHIDNIYISFANTFVYLALVATFCLSLYHFRRKLVYAMSVLVAIMILIAAQHAIFVPKQGLFILNSFDSTPIFYFSNHKGYLLTPDAESESFDFANRHKGLLSYYGINSIEILAGDTILLDGGKIMGEFASICGKNMAIINHNKWRRATAENPIDVDYVIVTKRYHSSFKGFKQLFGDAQIVLSGDIYVKQHELMVKNLNECGMPYYSVKENGALTLYLR